VPSPVNIINIRVAFHAFPYVYVVYRSVVGVQIEKKSIKQAISLLLHAQLQEYYPFSEETQKLILKEWEHVVCKVIPFHLAPSDIQKAEILFILQENTYLCNTYTCYVFANNLCYMK